jgi:hypothetical protein
MRTRLGVLAIAFLALGGGASRADDRPTNGAKAPNPPPQQKQPFPDLLAGLKATPGCLGVETARTPSGKQVIFAWFENKRAAMKWYYSDVHRQAMSIGFPNTEYRKPLKDVPADTGPILAIASITFAGKSHFKESALPISQIAIELYQPVPGGAFLGGRFAPAGLKVSGMKDYTPKEEKNGEKTGPQR